MNKKYVALITAVLIWGVTTCPVVNADSKSGSNNPMAEPLTYLHLYTDADGMTHFRVEKFDFSVLDEPGARPSLSYHEIMGSSKASLVKLNRGAVEDWHTAPRKQFAVVIQGEVELTAGDGEVRRLTPGSIALLADTSGKGHITKAIGAADHIALMIPVAATGN